MDNNNVQDKKSLKQYFDEYTEKYLMCKGCGYCCIKWPCPIELASYGYRNQVRKSCPNLYWNSKQSKYRCKAIETNELCYKGMSAGEGCCATLNTWRKEIKIRRMRDMAINSVMDMTPYVKDFKIGAFTGLMGTERCIFYKDVVLWRCASESTAKLRFLVMGGEIDCGVQEPYCIAVHDEMDDYYTYGDWKTLDEVKKWLDSPTTLY